MRKLLDLLEMIKFQHSIFALPFAVAAAFAASEGKFLPGPFGWILLAMVSARTCAMGFNRWADAEIDAENPRTAGRAIPQGRVSKGATLAMTVVSAGLFFLAAWRLNPLTLKLAPVALAIVCGYSYTKRFTPLCHFVLGLSLAIAPVGAWLGIRGAFDRLPLILAGGVFLWTAGFDILYACQDVAFDRQKRLRSIPADIGVPGALRIAAVLHAFSILVFALPIVWCGFGWVYGAGIGVIALLLVYEHRLVRPDDLARVNQAFFHVNAVVSVGIMAALLIDLFARRAG